MATIKDVAQMAGVSISTVSKYINGGHVKNAETIQRAIDTLDYRVNPFARNLKSQRSPSIGILLPDMTAPFYSNVITAMDRVFREHGFHSLISCYGSNHGLERDNLRFLISNGIEGLVYVPEDISTDEFSELTASSRIPTVQIDRMIQGVDSDIVLSNNTDAAYSAVSHLIEKGHRRIAIITGPKSVFTAKERLVGYLRALSDHGIIYDDALVISGTQSEFTTGYHGFETLMNLAAPPTAIFATNYNISIGIVTVIRDKDLQIPSDIDVFGFDCADFCSLMKFPIPLIRQPEQEIGQTAAKFLIERLDGYTGPPRFIRLNCEMVL